MNDLVVFAPEVVLVVAIGFIIKIGVIVQKIAMFTENKVKLWWT